MKSIAERMLDSLGGMLNDDEQSIYDWLLKQPENNLAKSGLDCVRCGKTGLQLDSIHTCTPQKTFTIGEAQAIAIDAWLFGDDKKIEFCQSIATSGDRIHFWNWWETVLKARG